jgi:hypothetical protein
METRINEKTQNRGGDAWVPGNKRTDRRQYAVTPTERGTMSEGAWLGGLSGNRRVVRRQYAAKKLATTRVLPGMAGYCRVTGGGKSR